MCHSRMFRREQRDERFEEELRYLLDHESTPREPMTPVVERERGEEPVAEPERERVPAAER